ncbi:LOW QUALITY PROTEIN: hypothetical protein V1478_013966 [Vespula squamosa]|uniref:Uncharacterized protein n=1 Tax=Vespula squamosa TaxID=30214 RepID=A0ABD2A924_VESSQ
MDRYRDSSIKIPRSFLCPFEKSTIIVTINLLGCFVKIKKEKTLIKVVVVVVVVIVVVVEIVIVVESAMMVSSRVVSVVLVVLVVEEVVEVVVEKRRCFREPRSTFNHLRSITSAEKTEHRLATGRESETMSAFNSSSLKDDTPEERIWILDIEEFFALVKQERKGVKIMERLTTSCLEDEKAAKTIHRDRARRE